MNNKKIFSVKQFWQSFMQLKVIGIICTALLLLFMVFPVISQAMSCRSAIQRGMMDASKLPVICDFISEYSGFLTITFILFTPILALNAWNFLNKRSTSDFYHALPYTRVCLYFSKIAAVIAWQSVILLTSMLSSMLAYKVFSKYYIVDYTVICKVYFAIFLCSLLCAAAISLACAVTGNIFSNICVTGLVLFFPRFVTTISIGVISSMVDLISQKHFMPILDNRYNILVGEVFSVFVYGNQKELLLSVPGYIYTFLLAVIMIGLGCWLFVKRKSETAGKAAIGKAVPFVIRTLIGVTICIIGVMNLVAALWNNSEDEYGMSAISTVVIVYIVAAIVVIVYECLANKNIRRIYKCIPSILAAYVLAGILGLGVYGSAKILINYAPQAEDVQYVRFTSETNSYYSRYNNYFAKGTQNIHIEDERIQEIFCEALASNSKALKEKGYVWQFYNGNYTSYEVYFKDGLIGNYRIVYLTAEQNKELGQRLKNVEEYRKVYQELPDENQASINWRMAEIPEQESKELYNILCEEVKSIDFTDWYENVNMYQYENVVDITFTKAGMMYEMSVPLTGKLPKTQTAYFKLVNRYYTQNQPEQVKKMAQLLKDCADGKKDGYPADISLTVQDSMTEVSDYWEISAFMDTAKVNGRETLYAIAEQILKGADAQQFDNTKPYVRVDSYYSIDEYRYENIYYYVQLDNYKTVSDYSK